MKGKENPPTDNDRRVILIGAWMTRFSRIFELYGKTIHSEQMRAFEDAFAHVDPIVLEYAFQEYQRRGKKFPTPGDIEDILREVREREADAAFTHLQKIIQVHWFGEIMPLFTSHQKTADEWHGIKTEYAGGWLLSPAPLDTATAFALEQAGGYERVSKLRGRDLEFTRKEFVVNHARFKQKPAAEIGPGKAEASKLLGSLQEKLK